jgi:hypothetical protein
LKSIGLALVAMLASACYQALGGGYTGRLADRGGDSVELSYLMGFGEILGSDEPTMTAKITVMGGGWGVRVADVFGVMAQENLDGASFFLRPGLALFVLGVEARDARDDEVWVGIGAELDVGFLFELGDELGLELGARTGYDLSYTGTGSGGFIGVFAAFAWTFSGRSLIR